MIFDDMYRFFRPGSWRRYLTALCFFWCGSIAHAQILDRIDVVPGDKEAAIVVRFGVNILYRGHAPPNEGSLVRVSLRALGSDIPESDLIQETMRSPKTARVPTATVLYPENGMLVTFSHRTRYSVRPGSDGRSIVITVPLLPPEKTAAPTATVVLPGQGSKIVTAEPKVLPAQDLPQQEPRPRFTAEPKVVPALELPQQEPRPRFAAEPKVLPAQELAQQEPRPRFTAEPKVVPALEVPPERVPKSKDQPRPAPVLADQTPPANLLAPPPDVPAAPIAAEAPALPDKKAIPEAIAHFPEPVPRIATEPRPIPAVPIPVESKPVTVISSTVPSAAPEVAPSPALPGPMAAAPLQQTPKRVLGSESKPVASASPPIVEVTAGVAVATPTQVAAGQVAAAPSVVSVATESPPPPAMPQTEVESRASGFIDEARQAIAEKDPAKAINRLNRVLGLPRSNQTEPAQALIGEARELNGEFLKAKAEYDLYLKLFPTGPAATRVKDRLAALPHDTVTRAATPKALPQEAGPAEWTYFGSLSSYYYTGKSQIETLTPPPPGELTFNKDTLSMVDQNSLVSSINLNARRRDAFSDTRIIYRATRNDDYLQQGGTDRSYYRTYSAYIDHNDRKYGYYVRAGRQNPNGMGVLERFDGVQGGYNINPAWRVNAVYGDAVEFGSPFKKNFYGASVDLIPQTGKPGISVYGIEQTLDGFLNRRAVGTELRYFDAHITGYATVDYDVLYKGVNIALLQGNYLTDGGTNYFTVLDHRRAPSYSLTNALPGSPGLTLKEMIDTQGLAAVRQQAADLSATSDMFSIGVMHPLTERWQLGVDYRMSQISATSPVDVVIPLAVIGTCLGTVDVVNNTCIYSTAAQEASGKNHVVTFQAIGNGLLFADAVGVGNVSLISAPTFTGQASSLSYVLPYTDQWRFDLNLRYYTQKDNAGGTQSRISPSFKATWQWQNSLYLEGEIGRETSKSDSNDRRDSTVRDYMYTGLRYDFR
jgi:hypothetical protein